MQVEVACQPQDANAIIQAFGAWDVKHVAMLLHRARWLRMSPSVNWRLGHDVSGDPVTRIRFDGATCRICPTRLACTSAPGAPRQLAVRLQAHHEALQAARQRQETAAFKTQYGLRAAVESSLSQGSRRFYLRRSRYLGLARTHLQQQLNTTAMNVVRVITWLRGELLGERRWQPGHLAQLAPHPLSRQMVLCKGVRRPKALRIHA